MPNTIGPYEVRGELGRGAMAVVWRGYDPNLEREVAIKEPKIDDSLDETTRSELAARFVREGRAAAKLNHPGIVTIHAADVYDTRPAIVMELIDGETLADILSRGPLELGSALGIANQLLDAVGYAHSQGVVHRDIKPDNIFVTRDGRVKLTDFGIAHVGSSATLTQAGTVMGTPGYMAPEQVTGQPVDARADLFAVGSILYEMLTGSNPFGATNGVAPTTVMYRIVHEAAPPIPDPVITALSLDITRIIATAMAKDPAYRFGDAQAFRTALTGGPIQAGGHVSVAPTVVSGPVPAALPVAAPAASSKGWTPYIIVGAIGVLVIGALLVFANGGGANSGASLSPASVEESVTYTNTVYLPEGDEAPRTVADDGTVEEYWVGTGLPSDRGLRFTYLEMGTERTEGEFFTIVDPATRFSKDGEQILVVMHVENATPGTYLSAVWIPPVGDPFVDENWYLEDSWESAYVGYYLTSDQMEIVPGHWVAAIRVNGEPAEFVEFEVY